MTDVVCAGCGSPQAAGSPYCAVCGREFPRTGRPVPDPAAPPVGQVQAAAASGYPGAYGPPGHPGAPGGADPRTTASGPVYRHSDPTAMTDPEVYTATQRAVPVPAPQAPTPYAGTGRRFGAWAIDAGIVGVVVAAVVLIGVRAVMGDPGEATVVSQEEFADLLGRLSGVYVLGFVLGLGYWIGLWTWEGRTGKTIGNQLLGIRTVDAATRGPVGFWRAFLRSLLVSLGSIACAVGWIFVLLSPQWDKDGRKQGWHDKAARSVVLDVRGSAEPIRSAPSPVAQTVAAPPALGDSPVGPPPASSPWTTAAAEAGFGQTPQHPAPQAPAPAAPPAPAQPDPWSFPSSGASAPGAGGLITGVPGVSAPASPAASPQHPAPQHPASQAPAPYPAPPQQLEEPDSRPTRRVPHPAPQPAPEQPSWDTTRMGLPTSPGALTPAPVTGVVLELESGARHTVDGPALIGRNPQSLDGAHGIVVKIDDPTRSVSKVHAELGVDSAGLWLTDRGSTNGTVVSAPGLPPRVAEPGARVRVPVGSTIHLGDRRVLVHPGQAQA